ncbi:DUF87 domain-containing protein [uncultured Nitratireductor sp.]|uniref:ATP-binding protein n=1 Tax=uncultured Nitratireductor sp. TaxID=520953 RepID=UPI0025D1A32D|nr:DUF87 domain-containing protein [uncultured Nitratireductor sp.]
MSEHSNGIANALPGQSSADCHVCSVKGSEAYIELPIKRTTDELRTTVGKFMAIAAGTRELLGVVTEVSLKTGQAEAPSQPKAVARVDLVGEISSEAADQLRFRRGVSAYPAIHDQARIISSEQLRLIFRGDKSTFAEIGRLHNDTSVPAYVDVESLVTKHFAVLGSTGVGKSSGLAIILRQVIAHWPELRVLILDHHNEYGSVFGDKANLVGPQNLRLPFWLFNFEEFLDVLYAGKPPIPAEQDILSELIPLAKTQYLNRRQNAERPSALRKVEPRQTGFTADTPVPYLMQDLVALIDERMGKLENRSSRMIHHRLIGRIETLKNDPRYAFMFANATLGGDTMVTILTELFRLEADGRPATVIQLASLPVEVVDAAVCVISRLAFDFGMWSDGAMPLLLVCEEAHRFASADPTVGFAPSKNALSRVAKEGRKYGVYLGLVTQRPAELDPTIISQCNTLFAMRMANERDQALLKSAVSDATANLVEFVPSLGTGEVVGFGEGMPLPVQFVFNRLSQELLPRSETAASLPKDLSLTARREFVNAVVERWRGSIMHQAQDTPPQDNLNAKPTTSDTAHTPTEQAEDKISKALQIARREYMNR